MLAAPRPLDVIGAQFSETSLRVHVRYHGGCGDHQFAFRVMPGENDKMIVGLDHLGPDGDVCGHTSSVLEHEWQDPMAVAVAMRCNSMELRWNNGADGTLLHKNVNPNAPGMLRADIRTVDTPAAEIRAILGQEMGSAPPTGHIETLKQHTPYVHWTRAHWKVLAACLRHTIKEKGHWKVDEDDAIARNRDKWHLEWAPSTAKYDLLHLVPPKDKEATYSPVPVLVKGGMDVLAAEKRMEAEPRLLDPLLVAYQGKRINGYLSESGADDRFTVTMALFVSPLYLDVCKGIEWLTDPDHGRVSSRVGNFDPVRLKYGFCDNCGRRAKKICQLCDQAMYCGEKCYLEDTFHLERQCV